MKKILYIHPTLDFGGAEMLRFMSLKYIDTSKYDIKICCIERKGSLSKKIENLGFEVTYLNRSSKPYNFLATIALLKYLLKNNFDLVQTSLFNANFHGRIAAIFARIPFIISEEHSEHYQYNSLKFLPYILSDRILSLFTHKIISCSNNMIDSISKKEKIPKEKFTPLINAVDPECFKNIKDRATVRKEMGLSDSDIVIGNIASVSQRKGHEYLIKSFARIEKSYPLAKFFIIGKENVEIKNRLFEMVKTLGLSGKVFFLGEREDVLGLLNAMDIFVISSVNEGIPLAVLEAMYLGIPVVSTDVGGLSEVITKNIDGILVPARDCDALAFAIVELLKDSKKRRILSENSKQTILTKFMPDRYINQLTNIYNELWKEQ